MAMLRRDRECGVANPSECRGVGDTKSVRHDQDEMQVVPVAAAVRLRWIAQNNIGASDRELAQGLAKSRIGEIFFAGLLAEVAFHHGRRWRCRAEETSRRWATRSSRSGASRPAGHSGRCRVADLSGAMCPRSRDLAPGDTRSPGGRSPAGLPRRDQRRVGLDFPRSRHRPLGRHPLPTCPAGDQNLPKDYRPAEPTVTRVNTMDSYGDFSPRS